MDYNYKEGDQILLELDDECIVGELVHLNEKKTRYHLKNCCDFYQKNLPELSLSNDVQIFYRNEIKSIRLLKSVSETSLNSLESSSVSSNLSIIALNEIKTTLNNVKVFHQIDIQFHESIKLLKTLNTIGINAEGIKLGRQSKISIISITTGNIIYLYDIVSIGIIPKELCEILESNDIKKVIHDSRLIADNLKYFHKINLNFVFDTMIANASLNGDKIEISLFKCIAEYFKLPENIHANTEINWHRRPLTDEQKNIAAQNVVYLLELQQHLNNLMLMPFYNTVNKYMNSLRNSNDPIGIAMEICHKKNTGIKEIENFNLKISENLVNNLNLV